MSDLTIKQKLLNLALMAMERGYLPDPLIRIGIRRLIASRLKSELAGGLEAIKTRRQNFLQQMRQSPIALVPETTKEQHYELPPSFFEEVLGPRLKYSSASWEHAKNLAEAEEEMLALYRKRSRLDELQPGQKILELGCGWGSLSLDLAKRYPKNSITVVSHSKDQKSFIEAKIKERGFTNLQVITADMNHFEAGERFDRIISIEMFEHMRNWEALFNKVHAWLKPKGLFFFHFFSHKQLIYPFEVHGPEDWMAKYFFSGGMIPCHDLPKLLNIPFEVVEEWQLSGIHYQKTARAWVKKMDQHRRAVEDIFREHYGNQEMLKWWIYWRVFFMATEELWGFHRGQEWVVSHYLLKGI